MSEKLPVTVLGRVPRGNFTVRKAAGRTGTTIRTTQHWTSEPRKVYFTRTQQKRERVQELRAKRLSRRAIAADAGCALGTVRRYVKQAVYP